jgi:hypothetical protein
MKISFYTINNISSSSSRSSSVAALGEHKKFKRNQYLLE